eukprot:9902637-Ditylum_brightwellii.AAC.1
MQELYDAGKKKLKPNTVTMNSAITTWAKIGEGLMGACWAEMLLQLMEKRYEAGEDDIKQKSLVYSSVIHVPKTE